MRVFICSTCYDLIDLRAELQAFFREAGAEAILSDNLSSEFQVMPDRNSIETCLDNVRNCDEFLIVLSNRYGPSLAKAGYQDVSATHLEYLEAVKCKKPIRMFVRDRLEADYSLYQKNRKDNPNLKLLWCKEQKDWKLFDLLEEHRKLSKKDAHNNWVWTFRDSTELKNRLTLEFKDAFARVAVSKLFLNGRVPFFEMIGKVSDRYTESVVFELKIRNIGSAVAVSPVLKIVGTSNKWSLPSLAQQISTEISRIPSDHRSSGSVINLSTLLEYSILEGQIFVDEGNLAIPCDANAVGAEITYKLNKRKYVGAATEMVLI
jgi:hypothetical protein